MRVPFKAVLVTATFLLASLLSTSPVAAAIGVTTTATQTYELRPQQHVVHVTIDLPVKNTTPSFTTYEPCIQYRWDPWYGLEPYYTTCPHTTNYYINESSVWVEDGARNLKLTADSGAVTKSVLSRSYGFTQYRVKFERIFYGHTRKIRATYDLASSAPRSAGGIRAGQAYASFCVSGNGPDGGQIRVITPTSFTFSHTESDGLTFSESGSGNQTIYTTGSVASPINAWACFDGVNLNGFARLPITAPDGRSVIVAAWPEDPEWAGAVAADVTLSLPALEKLVGRPLPGSGPVEIREVAGLGDYAGFFDPDTNVAIVSENYKQPGLVAHELSHAWFNGTTFTSTWLSEGYAGWVESQYGGESCDRLPTYQGTGKADLEDWTYLGPKSTAADRTTVDFQYAAACWVVSSVADSIGDDRMTTVLGAVFEGTNAYGAAGPKQTVPATWQRWLDAVDELGMVPAGVGDLDLVQDELAQVGVATDSHLLEARSEARGEYHALAAAVGGWSVPDAVRQPLSTWDFSAAKQAIGTARQARADLVRADGALPEINALTGPIAAQWQAAGSQADLDAVAALASREAAATEAIAAAEGLDVQADPVTRLGLLGTDTDSMFTASITAARNADADEALKSAQSIIATVEDARGQGWIRLAAIVGAGLALLVFAMLGRRRRVGASSGRRGPAPDSATMDAEAALDNDAGSPTGGAARDVIPTDVADNVQVGSLLSVSRGDDGGNSRIGP